MRTLLAFAIVLAACGSKSATPTTTGPSNVPKSALEAPAVTAPGVVATDDSPPPVLVLIDANGHRSLAAAASWTALATGTFIAGPKTAGDEASYRHVKENVLLGQAPKAIVDSFTDFRTDGEGRDSNGATDDPPPPEEEDRPDDGEDESGGIGTAMALEEGKMGRRMEAGQMRGPRWVDLGKGGQALRMAGIVGEVTSAPMKNVPAVVIPHPSTKAALVVKVVTELEAMIGVRNGGAIKPLRVQFQRDRDAVGVIETPGWLEVRIATGGLTIEAVPSKPVLVPWAEAAGRIKTALAEARDRRKLDPDTAVDVLVSDDLDAQHLVDVVVALDTAGVKWIGLGDMPTGMQLAARGHDPDPTTNRPEMSAKVPTVSVGNPNAQGDLDKEIIRRFVKRNLQKIQYCYEKALLAKPKLQGTVMVQFFITPNGDVATASGSGLDPEVANCVAQVIKGIEFPKPKGGGGVQVNYPFTFRPES